MGGDSVRISIRQQLGAGICLLVFCALALSLLMIDHNLSENYEEKVKADSVAAADSLARNIAQFINNTNIMNQMIASYPRLQELPREEQQQLLAGTVKRYPWVQLMTISRLDGTEIVRSQGYRATNVDRPWFRQFMQAGKPSLSPMFYSLSSTLPAVALTSGIYDEQGKLAGVMMSDINSAALQELVDSYAVGEGREVYLLDSDGTIATYPQHTRMEELYNYRTLKRQHLMRDVDGGVLRDHEGRFAIRQEPFDVDPEFLTLVRKTIAGEDGVREYRDADGERYLCAYRSVEFAGLDGRWSLLVVQRYSDAMEYVQQSLRQSLWIMIAVLLFSLAVTIWWAGHFTRPIVALAQTAKRVKAGDLSVRVPLTAKNELGYLERQFNAMIESLEQNRQERLAASQKIKRLAYHDSLTGLPNRVQFRLFLKRQLRRLQKGVVVFVDLDQFKYVNDTFGHSAGDRLLVQVSRRLVQAAGDKAFACRLGGDEFMVVLTDETALAGIAARADAIVQALAQEYKVSGRVLRISASVGIARYPEDGNTVEELMRKADTAMYRAKNNGRNCWKLYSEE